MDISAVPLGITQPTYGSSIPEVDISAVPLVSNPTTEVDISAVPLGITQPTYGSNIFRGGYLRGHPNKFSRIKLFGYWILDFGFWFLVFGFWFLDFGFLGFGFGIKYPAAVIYFLSISSALPSKYFLRWILSSTLPYYPSALLGQVAVPFLLPSRPWYLTRTGWISQ